MLGIAQASGAVGELPAMDAMCAALFSGTSVMVDGIWIGIQRGCLSKSEQSMLAGCLSGQWSNRHRDFVKLVDGVSVYILNLEKVVSPESYATKYARDNRIDLLGQLYLSLWLSWVLVKQTKLIQVIASIVIFLSGYH